MKQQWLTVSVVGLLAVIYSPQNAMAQLSSFGVLGGSTVTNTGSTTIVGSVGASPGSAITGFPPGIVSGGTIHAADATAAQAESDLTTLYNQLAGQACNTDLTGQNLGALTLIPGVYCFTTSAALTGTVTLDAQGNPNALFVIKTGSTLTTASTASALLINGGSTCNVFWQVGSSATLGTGSSLVGTIAALTSITLNTGASLTGRALARNGAVTLDSNSVTPCQGGSVLLAPPATVSGVPAVSLPVLGGLALLLAGLGSILARKAYILG